MTAADLVAAADAALRVPRAQPADSFVLHAPLELAARVGLLPHVRPDGRDAALARIADLTARYLASGDPVKPVTVADGDFASAAEATTRMVEMIDAGELDEVDRVAAWLGRHTDATGLARQLAGPLLPHLAAAGHAPILLWLLPRVAPDGVLSPELVRGPARELARNPAWRFRWFEHTPTHAADAPALAAAVATTPHLGIPESTFVFPTMLQVDPLAGGPPPATVGAGASGGRTSADRTGTGPDRGVAAAVLADVVGGTDIAARAAELRRLAAWSMLLEPPEHAPYGWTHALTIPQAVLGVAGPSGDPATALAVAASYLVGFRAALARGPLLGRFPTGDPAIAWPTPDPAHGSNPRHDGADRRLESALDEVLDDLLAEGPLPGAAAVWHAPDAVLDGVPGALATRASARQDAHLVKYTLACLDAADADPGHRRLFLAAATSLLGWWHVVADE